jgi:hypothetical protein
MKQKLNIFCQLLSLSLVLGACGAKDKEPEIVNKPIIEGQETDELKDQTPICYDTQKNCPTYVAKIVSLGNNFSKHCTGVLINSTTMMTSATCLAPEIREEGSDCTNKVHIFFPETKDSKASRFSCESISTVSNVDPNLDPSLWQNNIALIKIAGGVGRASISPVNLGMQASDKLDPGKEIPRVYDLWKVSTESNNGRTSFIKKFTCNVIKESYANPFNSSAFSPNSTIGNCWYKDADDDSPKEEKALYDGSEGGAVMITGKMVGILGQRSFTEEGFKSLQDKGIVHESSVMRPMNFATNIACLQEYFNAQVPEDCYPELSEELLAIKRKAVATSTDATGLDEAKNKIKQSTLLDTGAHLQWETQFSKVINQQIVTKHIPLCYYKTDQWLKKEFHRFILGYKTKQDTEMTLDGYVIDIKLDGLLKPSAQYKKTGTIKYGMTIRPRDISKNKPSELSVRGKFAGVDFNDPYPAIGICK